MALATRFARNSTTSGVDRPLSNEQIFQVAPSVFAAEAHDSRSARYTYIPTIDVLNGLRKEGFEPFFAAQSKCRLEGKSDFTKHLIRLRQNTGIQKAEANEIILVNSHDGTSSYQMLAGMFRFVCLNGMVTGDKIEDIRVKHRGNIIDNVIDAAYTIVDNFDIANQSMDEMKRIELKPAEAEIFARAALALKYDEDKAPVAASKLLTPHRWADNSDSTIWTNFNVIQENIMRGGQKGTSSTGRRTTTRPVASIDNNIKLNKALWILADEMARIKA